MSAQVASNGDPTSVGAILLKMGAVTEAQLEEVIKEQNRLRADAMLGRLLVARKYCTEEQFKIAMAAQESMRAGDKNKEAHAVADIALARTRRRTHVAMRKRILAKGSEAVRRITSNDHPAITPEMLQEAAQEK